MKTAQDLLAWDQVGHSRQVEIFYLESWIIQVGSFTAGWVDLNAITVFVVTVVHHSSRLQFSTLFIQQSSGLPIQSWCVGVYKNDGLIHWFIKFRERVGMAWRCVSR